MKKKKRFDRSIILKNWKKLGVLGFFFLVTIVAAVFILRSNKDAYIRMFLTEREWVKEWRNYPDHFFIPNVYVGLQDKDGLGQIRAEVVDLIRPVTSYTQEVAVVTVKLKANFNSRTGVYSYRGLPLVVGDYQRLLVGGVRIQGYLMEVGEDLKSYVEKEYTIEVSLEEGDARYLGMENTRLTGVLRETAEKIKVGDLVMDNRGKVIVKILEKNLSTARRSLISQGGKVSYNDDEFVSGRLKVMLRTAEIDGVDYWKFLTPVQVGGRMQLNFKDVIIPIRIVGIEAVENVEE